MTRNGARLERSRLLEQMRAVRIPEGTTGLWKVERKAVRFSLEDIQRPQVCTFLRRYTMATAHQGGECVMSDDLPELRRHLEFVLAAHGRVLITGLGLGCVLRGALANPSVEHVDLVERDPSVIRLVWPHCDQKRVTLHQADAVEWLRRSDGQWDVAWHDLWSDPDASEEALPVTHQRLMIALRGRVRWQGAWAFPRHVRRILRDQMPELCAWGNA